MINIFLKKDKNTIYVIVCLYVDDMLILNNNTYIIKTTKMLISKFRMKNIGAVDVIFKIYDVLTLSQCHCIKKIVNKFIKK